MWISGKLRVSYYGDMLRDSDRVRFKFEPNRHHMKHATKQSEDIPSIDLYYSSLSKTIV